MLFLRKGWVKSHTREVNGHHVQVAGYWREHLKPLGTRTWQELGLPSWKSIMRFARPTVLPRWTFLDEGRRDARVYLNFLFHLPGVKRTPDGRFFLVARDGVRVFLGSGAIAHLRSRQDTSQRAGVVPAILQTLQQPWEIWRQPVGKHQDPGRLYLRGFYDSRKRTNILIFVKVQRGEVTFWTMGQRSHPQDIDKRRHGTLMRHDIPQK